MRKSICLLISGLFIAALLAGCVLPQQATSGTTDPTTTTGGPTIPSQPTDPTDPTDPAQTAESREIPFMYQRIGAERDDILDDPILYPIHTREQLDSYIAENASDSDFADAVAKYDDAFFADQTLLLIAISDGTISVEHEVKRIVQQPDGSYVLYLDAIYPLFVDWAVGQWHILVEVEGCIPENAQITIETTMIEATWE